MSGPADNAPAPTRCGFAAILGAPNVGKSTLLNRLVGTKVSIVSPKVQTTRTRVLGIHLVGATQIVFVDTPGIFRPRRRLDRAMVAAAWQGADEADAIVLVVDAKRGLDSDTAHIVEDLNKRGRPAILALNKIDLVKKPVLLALAADLNARGRFTDTLMISAETGDGVEALERLMAGCMPEGPWMFPEDQVSDMPLRLLAAEITREKLFRELHQELPYALAVETEKWEERKDGSVRIDQVVHVEKETQKKIVVGKAGARIKSVGSAARAELTEILERPVHLFLFVRVTEGWSEDPERFRDWGLDPRA